VEPERIADLLQPFLGGQGLAENQLHRVTIYVDLLLRWNARINLTALRDADAIVTRHFGESFFAARHLLPRPKDSGAACPPRGFQISDLGSGAGFPGLPIKIWAPEVNLTLIESQNKKATFLKEVVRTLQLEAVTVFPGRGEELESDADSAADLVTVRAVEQFERALPVAAGLVRPGGRLALLIGASQENQACQVLPQLQWDEPIAIPLSSARVLLVGTKLAGNESD